MERKAFVAGWRVEPASLIYVYTCLWKFVASSIGYGVPTPLMWKVLLKFCAWSNTSYGLQLLEGLLKLNK